MHHSRSRKKKKKEKKKKKKKKIHLISKQIYSKDQFVRPS